ncbi:hypothetical protein C0995_009860 [Termitomyces sp. Mi166|nr:hypothetical protein C0995_009860 [Termitomyces sp. Mi166\
MIVDLNTQKMTTEIPQDSPPSYEAATDNGDDYAQEAIPKGALNHDTKHPISETSPLQVHNQTQSVAAGPSHMVQPGYTQTLPPVHHYVNRITGEHITSFRPPDDPEMICLQEGKHILHTQFGILGAF